MARRSSTKHVNNARWISGNVKKPLHSSPPKDAAVKDRSYFIRLGPWNIWIQQKWALTGILVLTGLNYAGYVYLEADKSKKQGLNQQAFTPFTLTDKQPISTTCSIFTLKPLTTPKSTEIYSQAWKKGIWSVELKQPQLQISRFYTPLPNLSNQHGETPELRFLIRKEEGGEVSSYLHKLEVGSKVELRGPKMEYEIPDEVETVLFIAGGTGIAPALQTAYNLSSREGDTGNKSLKIMWANRRAEDIELLQKEPFARESLRLKCSNEEEDAKATRRPKVFVVETGKGGAVQQKLSTSVQCYVDEDFTWIKEDAVRPAFSEILGKNDLNKVLVMVAGPDGLISYLAGRKPWSRGVQQQGDLGGLLRNILPAGCRVRKL